MINLNILDTMKRKNVKKVFYSSSACIYPKFNQLDPENHINKLFNHIPGISFFAKDINGVMLMANQHSLL